LTLVRWTEQAVEDLRSIRLFIERDSPRYGRLVAERLFDATEQIALFPRAGRVVPDLGRESVRELIVGEYRIVYRVEEEAAVILTVFRSLPFPTGPRLEGWPGRHRRLAGSSSGGVRPITKCCRLRSLRSLRPTWPEALVARIRGGAYSPADGL
jgi:toxin ParE1/3/4